MKLMQACLCARKLVKPGKTEEVLWCSCRPVKVPGKMEKAVFITEEVL